MKNLKDKITETLLKLQDEIPEYDIVVMVSLEEFNSIENVKVIIDKGTDIGGVQLDYSMGHVTIDDIDVKVIGSSKLSSSEPTVYVIPKHIARYHIIPRAKF